MRGHRRASFTLRLVPPICDSELARTAGLTTPMYLLPSMYSNDLIHVCKY